MSPAENQAEVWDEKIRTARATREQSASTYEQTVRDAHAAGRSASDIARALGIKDRTGITRILRAEQGEVIAAPMLPTVVYLRGPGHGEQTWATMHQVMHQRGWYSTGDATQAWHLSRAGATTVHVDFSIMMDDDPVTVSLMQAVYAQPADEADYPVKELLPTLAGIKLERAHPEAANFRVPVQTRDAEWKRIAGREHNRPRQWDDEATSKLGRAGAFVLDCQQIARWVADLLE